MRYYNLCNKGTEPFYTFSYSRPADPLTAGPSLLWGISFMPIHTSPYLPFDPILPAENHSVKNYNIFKKVLAFLMKAC